MVRSAQAERLRRKAAVRKGKTYPVEILAPKEVRALTAQLLTISNSGIRHRALIVLLYRTGLRISEALDLRPKDVDLESGCVAVIQRHGESQRPYASVSSDRPRGELSAAYEEFLATAVTYA